MNIPRIETACEFATSNRFDYSSMNRRPSKVMFKGELMNNYIPISISTIYNNDGTTLNRHAMPITSVTISNSNQYVLTYYNPNDAPNTRHYCTYENFCDGTAIGRILDGAVFVS